MHDFNVCPAGTCLRHPGTPQVRGSESAAIVQRLDDLMRRCREDGHHVIYRDLIEVRGSGAGAADSGEVMHVRV